jgi:hypothetical protein
VTMPGLKPATYWPTSMLLLIPVAMVKDVVGVAANEVSLPRGRG